MSSGLGIFESDALPSEPSRFTSTRDSCEPVSNKDVEVAEYLMDRKLHLSALEYYFEQLERGKKIPLLHNFFTDVNFLDASVPLNEEGSFGIAHYQSMSTLDSVDIGRVSDDGNSLEDKLKVLEFELRKKNEEIHSLRNELTTLTMGPSVEEDCTFKEPDEDSNLWNLISTEETSQMRPHELRAISVLIHEQLLELGYRITAVQFAEESEANGILDVESWGKVGINLSKPPKLLHLLRSYWSGCGFSAGFHGDLRSREVGVQTELNGKDMSAGSYPRSEFQLELSELQSKLTSLESKNAQLNVQTLHWRNKLICLEREHAELSGYLQSIPHDRNCSTNLVHSARATVSGSIEQHSASVAVLPLQDSDETAVVKSYTVFAKESPVSSAGYALYSRSPSVEFHNRMVNVLPKHEQFSGCECDTFQLTTSFDELVMFVTDRLEMVLVHLTNEGKVLLLPLLTQLICLHSVSAVRDRLLRVLFNLFGPQYKQSGDQTNVTPVYSPSVQTTSQTTLVDCNQHRALILHACRLVASYLGPTRLESELIPQLWSQLNERPSASSSKRLLLVSACGIVSPCIPTQLRSSLMLSILESNLDDERNEVVAAATIRSLACLVTVMSDCDKLPQIIQRLTQLLLQGHPFEQHISVPDLVQVTTSNRLSNSDEKRISSIRPMFLTTVDWLLPAVAQWCLELDILHTTLIDPWLDHIDAYLLNARNTETDIPHDMATRCLGILEYLVPFLHAWLMVTLVEPDISDKQQTYWLAAHCWSNRRFSNETIGKFPDPHEWLIDLSSAAETIASIDVQLVLGKESYPVLESLFEDCLRSLSDDNLPVSADAHCLSNFSPKVWSARLWLDKLLLPKLCELLLRNPRACILEAAKAANVSLYKHGALLENFVKTQYSEHFACPWSLSPQSDLMVVCLCACRFLASFGRSLGANGSRELLSIPLRNQLMIKTELGNYEFDHAAMQTGLLAAYCCVLSSVRAKSESNKVRMLLTNAIFLHTREAYPLESVRLAIWCLCLTVDLEYAVVDLILPALRPCMSCADSIVRRAVASLLHSLIEVLRFAKLNRLDKGCLDRSSDSDPNVLDQVFQLVSQLARDDLTGQRRRLNADEADWSVLAVALGPVYSFFTLCRTTLPSERKKIGLKTLVADGTASFTFASPEGSTFTGKETTDVEEQVLELVELQFNLVTGMLDIDAQSGDSEPGANRLLITQQRFWIILTHALISFTDHLMPLCSDGFRDKVLLPWLYQLAEMSNSLPNLDQRARLADRLFAVLSTAAYSVQLEESLLLWLVPGLDRVRLDLVEAGDMRRSHEVEQLLNDLYSRIKADEVEPSSSSAKDLKGLRSTVSMQLTRFTHRVSRPLGVAASAVQTSREQTKEPLPRSRLGRLSLRKR